MPASVPLLSVVLFPFAWVIEAVLVTAHGLVVGLGLPTDLGLTWVLALLALVVVIRLALLPLALHQQRAARRTRELRPALRAIQDRYRGRRDEASRRARTRETLHAYADHGVSPLTSSFALFAQLPVLLALLQVLLTTATGTAGVGAVTAGLAASFSGATLLGAPLGLAALTGPVPAVGLVVLALMVVLQLGTVLLLERESDGGAAARVQRRVLLVVLPVLVVVGSVALPLGVLVALLCSNAWTLVQQWVLLRLRAGG